MRLAAIVGALALIAAIVASVAIYVLPHPTQLTTGTTTYPSPGGIVTYGQGGEVSPEEAREILLGPKSTAHPLFPMIKGSFGTLGGTVTVPAASPVYSVEEGGFEFTSTNVQVPGVDEGDILKLAPPFGLYMAKGTIYLLRLWPPEELGIIDSRDLVDVVYEAISTGSIRVNVSDYGVSVNEWQALAVGDLAVVSFTYQLVSPGPRYWCSSNESINVNVAGHDFTFVYPTCYPEASLWGTAVAVYRFNETGLQLISYHILSGLRAFESRLSDGVVYLFTAPYTWMPTGDESIDGVSVLEAGPTYVVGTSEMGNTFMTIVAIKPETGEVGVTNVILPAETVMGAVLVYMREGTAYLVVEDMAPPIKAEEIAKAVRACAPKAPVGLRQALEALSPDAAPGDVIEAIKAWVRDVEDELEPVVEWIHDITGGTINVADIKWGEELELPENLGTVLEQIKEEVVSLSEFSGCVADKLGNVTASSTRVVKLVFSGLSGSVVASSKVPGVVYDRFAIHEDSNFFYIVTTEEVGRAYPVLPVMPYEVVGPYPAVEGVRVPLWSLVTGLAIGSEVLNYIEDVDNLTDLFTVTPVWGWQRGSSLYVLNASDLTPVSSLTGIAPGERVYAARYVGDYLYLVTFRQTDPLFGIDISDPANPRILGWLEMPGFSEYLHPWRDRYLVGVGVGESWVLKVDLYNVSDPSNIVRVSSVNVTGWSQALWEHHAFQPIDDKTFAIPVTFSDEGSGIAVFQVVTGEGLKYLGMVEIEGPQRSARINDVVYAFGYRSAVAATLPDLSVITRIQLFEESTAPGVTTVTVVETATPG